MMVANSIVISVTKHYAAHQTRWKLLHVTSSHWFCEKVDASSASRYSDEDQLIRNGHLHMNSHRDALMYRHAGGDALYVLTAIPPLFYSTQIQWATFT